jgi:hypothetical protein
MDKRWLGIGPVVLLVTGCVAGRVAPVTNGPTALPMSAAMTPSSSPGVGIVPWSSETPAPPLLPIATPIPEAAACRLDQLAAGNAGWGGATGSLLGGFLVWNPGGLPCLLQGVPVVAIIDAAGRPLKVSAAAAPSPPAQEIVLASRQPAPVLNREPPRGLASETLQWFNWCGAAPQGPLSLAVTLPGGGMLRLPIVFAGGGTSAPRCDDPAAPSTMTVSPFEETPGPSPTEPPAVPAEGLRLALEVPDEASAGGALHYIALLTNPTASAIPLSPCPAYRESLVTPTGQLTDDYVLDCLAMPWIGPGETQRFAMVLEIPPSQLPTANAALVWELDPYYSEGFLARGPAQKVAFRIVAP